VNHRNNRTDIHRWQAGLMPRKIRGVPILVHRLTYNDDVAAGQLAVFQGASDEHPPRRMILPPAASPARTALPPAHFERSDVIIICETVHQVALFSIGSSTGQTTNSAFKRPEYASLDSTSSRRMYKFCQLFAEAMDYRARLNMMRIRNFSGLPLEMFPRFDPYAK
jgi:hypothetical protein